MLERQTVVEAVVERLGELLDETAGKGVAEHADLRDIPGFDSLGILELLVWLEERFDVDLPDDELTVDDLSSVAKIADCVMAHVPDPAGPAQGR